MITFINSYDRKVRKIHKLAIGSKMYVEAILIPKLDLKVIEVGVPECFNRYNSQWAHNDDGLRGPVGQLLLGAYCVQFFPYNLIHLNGKNIMVRKMSLLV